LEEVSGEVVQGIRLNPEKDASEKFLYPKGINTVADCMKSFQSETVVDTSSYPYPCPIKKKQGVKIESTHVGLARRRGCASCGIKDLGVVDPPPDVHSYTNSEYKWKSVPIDCLEQYKLSEDAVYNLERSEYKNFYTFSQLNGL